MAKFLIPAQARAAGEGVILNNTGLRSCAVFHEDGTPTITVRGSGCLCNQARYSVSAHVITTALVAEAVQIGLYVDGELLPDTIIGIPAVAVGDVISGDLTTEVAAGSNARISLRAITDASITGGNVIVNRRA